MKILLVTEWFEAFQDLDILDVVSNTELEKLTKEENFVKYYKLEDDTKLPIMLVDDYHNWNEIVSYLTFDELESSKEKNFILPFYNKTKWKGILDDLECVSK